MAVQIIPQNVLALIGDALYQDVVAEDTAAVAVPDETSNGTVDALYEIESLRDSTTKHFRMSDGSFVAVQYSEPVHFLNGEKWVEYDNTLVASVGNGYSVKRNDISVNFANSSSAENLVSVSKNGNAVIMTPVSRNTVSPSVVEKSRRISTEETALEHATNLTKHNSALSYDGIFTNVDVEYIVSGSKVKENIIVKTASSKYVYDFILSTGNMVAAKDSEGNINITDANGKLSFFIPKGYMYDSNGQFSEAVEYTLKPAKGQTGIYLLTVSADEDWINDETRVFPVTIDPTLFAGEYLTEQIDDACAYNAYPDDVSGTDHFLMSGGTNANNIYKLFVKLNTLPTLPDSAIIVDAKLNLRQLAIQTSSWMNYEGDSPLPFGTRRVTGSWDESTLCWNNIPSVEPVISDYCEISAAQSYDFGVTYSFDITDMTRGWYDGTYANHGVAIYPVEEFSPTGKNAITGFYTSENPNTYNKLAPMFAISYRDTKGLESIWTYSSHSAGSAGAGYVNGFNGNLVFVHDDISTRGSILPVTVSHVYNSYLYKKNFDASSCNVGYGFKLSLQETVEVIELNDETWYKYTDSDGTELYFYNYDSDSSFESEDGNGLEIKKESNGKFTMSDEFGNKRIFNASGKLESISDVFGNKKTVTYDGDKIDAVKYTPIGSTEVTQLTFEYNSFGALMQITNTDNITENVTFYYSSTYNGTISENNVGYLRKIVQSKGGTALYEYDSSGMLISAQDDETDYKICYEYLAPTGSNTFKKVSKVTEYGGEAVGQTVGFKYNVDSFSVITSGADNEYSTSSDNIVTTYKLDHFGRAVCSYSSDSSANTLYGAACAEYTDFVPGSKKNNKIKTDSVKAITNQNLLKNGNLESDSSWTTSVVGNGSASVMSESPYFGEKSFKLNSTAVGGKISATQTLSLLAGTYNLSAFVKTSSISGDGAYIQIGDTKSEKVKGTTNSSIMNGWQRINVTIDIESAGSKTVSLVLENAIGTCYFDCIQLEKSETPSKFNFIENGSFTDNTSGWSLGSRTMDANRGPSLGLAGNVYSSKTSEQTIQVDCTKNTTFMLSGWARANSVELSGDETRTFELRAKLIYADDSDESFSAHFNPDIKTWQFTSAAIVPKKDVKTITVMLCYDNNANSVAFDDISLTVEPAQTYAYDDDGNLVSTLNAEGNESLFDYASNGVDLAEYTNILGEKYEYTYKKIGNIETHLAETVKKTDAANNTQTLTYEYDSYGNVTSSKLTSSASTDVVKSSATYTDFGNLLASATDNLGNITTYGYNSSKLLSYVQNAKGVKTNYLYDSRGRNSAIYVDVNKDGAWGDDPTVYYEYLNGRLWTIAAINICYVFTYDAFGNTASISCDDELLAEYTYAPKNGNLIRVDYGNGDYEEYAYDRLDRLVSVSFNGVKTYELTFSCDNTVSKILDCKAGIEYNYEYDSLSRLVRGSQTDIASGQKTLTVSNTYDSFGRSKGTVYNINGSGQSYQITYKDGSNLVDRLYIPTTSPLTNVFYSYDAFDRLSERTFNLIAYTDLAESFTYWGGTANGENHTSGRVRTHTLKTDDTISRQYTYNYDAIGNITAVQEGTAVVYTYSYDNLNQLVRENNRYLNKTFTYTYDIAGNITEVKTYPFSLTTLGTPTATDVYTYSGNTLVSVNGVEITSDEIGNPLNWYNGISSMSWNGRELISLTKDGKEITNKYNADGLRVEKTFDGGVYKYYLDGSKIIREDMCFDDDIYTFKYYYDIDGSPISFDYNGTLYILRKNLQGDVIPLLDKYGNVIANYTYDAWGKVYSVTDSNGNEITDTTHVAHINPIRYRSYYYDTDTGLYYLNSRYYDPELGRFLNADGYVTTGQGLLSYNMFVYCANNPVMYVDYFGEAFAEIGTLFDCFRESFRESFSTVKEAYYTIPTIWADGPLPVVDIAVGVVVVSASAYAIVMGVTDGCNQYKSRTEVKVEEREKTSTLPKDDDPKTYYHVTSLENARKIMTTGYLKGSESEFGHVFAWAIKPTKRAIRSSGARNLDVIIAFETNASFIPDTTITNLYGLACRPVVSLTPLPIKVTNVRICILE